MPPIRICGRHTILDVAGMKTEIRIHTHNMVQIRIKIVVHPF